MGALSLLLTLGVGLAYGQEADVRLWLVPVEGEPRPGDLVTLEVGAAVGGLPLETDELPQLRLDEAQPVGNLESAGPGRWQGQWRVGAEVRPGAHLSAHLSLDERSEDLPLTVAGTTRSSLSLPDHLEAVAGRGLALRIPVSGTDLPAPSELQVSVGEGEIQGVSLQDGQLILSWVPGPDPLPRVVPVLVRDGCQPRRPPAWTVVRLTGRPRIPIETDPGARVRLEVGGRTYGPVTAGVDGVAEISPEVMPGETLAEVVASDELGNERRSRISLAGAPAVALQALAEGPLVPGRPPPDLHVLALRGDGHPWVGAAPSCRTAVSAPLSLVVDGPGLWRASLPAGAESLFDLRVECTLAGQGHAALRVPVDPSVPTALRLRVWPPELDGDLPMAQVQSWLEGPLGERLPAQGITLSAERGALQLEPGNPATVVASYDGTAAVSAGRDRIEARWTPPPGEGGAWGLELALAGPPVSGSGLPVQVQALDRLGRPLAGVEVEVEVDRGEGDRGEGDRGEGNRGEGNRGEAGHTSVGGITGPDGQVQLSLPVARAEGPWIVEARAGSVERRHLLFLTEQAQPGALAGAGLLTVQELALRTGDVRRISIEARPASIEAGGAETTRIVVGLQDQSGNAVTDVPLQLGASEGEVGRPHLTEDGTFVADYTPPARLPYGNVELSVSGPEGEWSAHTRLELRPRQLRRAPGLAVGWLVGPKGIQSPWGDLELDTRLPLLPAALLGRVQVGVYGARAQVTDSLTGSPVAIDMVTVPLSLSLLGRLERGRWAGWLGGGAAVAPYNLVATFGDSVATRGWGLSRLGGEAVVGGGFRVRGTEIQLQAAWVGLSLPPSDVGFEGAVGGARLSLGWKLLY